MNSKHQMIAGSNQPTTKQKNFQSTMRFEKDFDNLSQTKKLNEYISEINNSVKGKHNHFQSMHVNDLTYDEGLDEECEPSRAVAPIPEQEHEIEQDIKKMMKMISKAEQR